MKKQIITLLLCSPIIAFAQKTNFSGKYKIIKEKVNFGGAPEWIVPRYITVDQKKDQVFISRVNLDRELKEQPALTDTLAFSGTIFTRNNTNGTKSTTVLKWLNDQSFTLDKQSGAQNILETWTLEDGGKTLHVDRDIHQANGMEYTTHCYFQRQ